MIYIIVNPASKSGAGKRQWEALKQELNKNSLVYEVFFTQKERGASACISAIMQRYDPQVPNTLCVLGGDGTMNEIVTALADHKDIAISYLPTGSSNDLAKALQITSSPAQLLERIRKPEPLHADTGILQAKHYKNHRFCVSCGIGLDAAVCKEALDSRLKDTLNRLGLGKLTYAGIALRQLIVSPITDCDITLDDHVTRHFDKLLFAVAMIHPYEGGGIKMAPMADCHDGKFDIMIVAGLRKWRALYLLPMAFFGLHTKAKNVYFFKSTSMTLQTDTPLIVHTDGEYCGKQNKITLSCQKDGLKYL